MKSTIQEQQKNNLVKSSKNAILFLGVLALSFTNGKAANECKSQDLEQPEFATIQVAGNQENQLIFVNQSNTVENTGNDTAIFDPNSVVKTTYVKSIEDIITENKLITESQTEEVQPLLIDTTLEDKIQEGNQIIESEVTNEVFPLDFEKINHSVKRTAEKSSAILSQDLKL